jgi:UDP-N-acetylmuramoyl-L-alanyl-D-glutamate--2,6-diaminopimelate ligase
MLSGLRHAAQAVVITDRGQAIAHTVKNAEPHDVVLLAGKGHEAYQEIHGIRHPFSDVRHAQQALLDRRAHV